MDLNRLQHGRPTVKSLAQTVFFALWPELNRTELGWPFPLSFTEFVRMMSRWAPRQRTCTLSWYHTESLLANEEEREGHRQETAEPWLADGPWPSDLNHPGENKHINPVLRRRLWSITADNNNQGPTKEQPRKNHVSMLLSLRARLNNLPPHKPSFSYENMIPSPMWLLTKWGREQDLSYLIYELFILPSLVMAVASKRDILTVSNSVPVSPLSGTFLSLV